MRTRTFLLCGCLALTGIAATASSTKPFPPVPNGHTQLAPPADPNHFTFIMGGDNRSAGHNTPMPPALDQICREIGLIHPPFVLWTGDVIEGYNDSVPEANAEYDAFLRAASLCGVPMFNAPGNHEFSLDAKLLPVYEQRIGPLYGSFDYGNSHFIALNSTAVQPNGAFVGGAIDDAQWAWLQADLEANKAARNTFVMLHHYVFGPPDVDTPTLDSGFSNIADRDRLHALMVKYGVRAVFCGHNHIYWHTNKDGVEYFISGGAGAPLDATPDKGGYLHYVLMTVDGTKLTSQILQPWHLETDYPEGDDEGAHTERVRLTNTNDFPVTAGRVVFHLAAPSAGQTLTVEASTAYKKKTKLGKAQIVSVQPVPGKQEVEVAVEVALPPARTTEVRVLPGAPTTK